MTIQDRLVRLAPLPFLAVIDYGMQVGPHDAQTNLCQWVQNVYPVSDNCLHNHTGAVWVTLGIGLATTVAWFLWPEGRNPEQPRPAASTLRQTAIAEIAEYLANESKWGWKQRLKLSLQNFVRDGVPHELRRAARAGKVRFLGSPPNSDAVVEIGAPYWQHATFDKDRIWDPRTNFFSEVLPSGTPIYGGGFNYQHGSAPLSEVLETWPKASFPLRTYVNARLFLRRLRYGFPQYLSDAPPKRDEYGREIRFWMKPPEAVKAYTQKALRQQYVLYRAPETMQKICVDIEKKLAAGILMAKGMRTPNSNGLVEVPIPAQEWNFLKLNPNNETAIGNGIEYTHVLIAKDN